MANDDYMDKYAVETGAVDEHGTKLASNSSTCRLCGKKGVQHGDVLLCPVHGSKGFESPSGKLQSSPGTSS